MTSRGCLNPNAWMARFVTMPTIITGPGQYVTRGGERVTIHQASSNHDFGCLGSYSNGIRDGWHKCGRLNFGQLSNNDIIEKIAAT